MVCDKVVLCVTGGWREDDEEEEEEWDTESKTRTPDKDVGKNKVILGAFLQTWKVE